MLGSAEMDIMQLLMEDDYGLWEIAWRLGGVEAAVPVVERLRQRGLAELHVREGVDAESVPVVLGGRVVDLQDPGSWEEPIAGGLHLLLIATEAGRDAVRHVSSDAPRLEEE